MANRLLRNIAVTIGAGLAVGIARGLVSRPIRRPAPNWQPILSRLETIESRVTLVELSPPVLTVQQPEEIEALSTLVSSQSEDIAALRQDLQKIETRNAQQVEAFGQKVVLLDRQVPNHIEAAVSAKIGELEQKMRGEFQEIHHRTVDAFAEAIESRVVNRIASVESSLVDHSHSIGTLREKSLKTEDNLNRLLDAVERLCARAEAQTQTVAPHVEPPASVVPPPAPQAPVAEPLASFASQLQQAIERQTEPEPERVLAAPGPKREFKSLGVAIVGLAFLALRLIRS